MVQASSGHHSAHRVSPAPGGSAQVQVKRVKLMKIQKKTWCNLTDAFDFLKMPLRQIPS
jgi:hypothetical protein